MTAQRKDTTQGDMARRRSFVEGCLILLLMTAMLRLSTWPAPATHAQSGVTQWGEHVVLFDGSRAASAANPRVLFYPWVVVDTEDSIKILWEVSVGSTSISSGLGNGIYCIEGDGTRWSEAVDVIVAPGGGRTFWPQHAVDPWGRLHLVWVGPNGILYYSRVPSGEACQARSWVTDDLPIRTQVMYGDIAVDEEGVIHVVYAARGYDVHYMCSEDDGLSWSYPVPISAVPPTVTTAFPSIAVDWAGRIHVAWEEGELPSGLPHLGLFYAVSENNGGTWSSSLMVADGNYTQPNIAVLNDDTTHLFWNGRAGVRGRYHQWSADGGRTWTSPIEFIPKGEGGGQTGFPRFAADSSGKLHLVSGTDAVTYMVWDGQQWHNPPDNILGYLEYPNIAISRGRVLHVVASDFHRIVYIQGVTDAPEATPQARLSMPAHQLRQTETAKTQSNATDLPSPTPTATAVPLDPAPPSKGPNPLPPVVLGAGLSLIVVLAAMAVTIRRQRQQP